MLFKSISGGSTDKEHGIFMQKALKIYHYDDVGEIFRYNTTKPKQNVFVRHLFGVYLLMAVCWNRIRILKVGNV